MIRLVSFWRPSPLVRKLFRGSLLGASVVLVLFLLSWLFGLNHPKANFSGRDSMPVNAPQDIQFLVETVSNIQTQQGENYFVNYRLEREKFRQETKEMLETLLNSPETKSRSDAQAQWLELSMKIKREGEIENLLKIKGFKDGVVNVSKDGVNVVILAPNLSAGEISIIQEIVVRITNIRLDKIIISTRI
ncbi:MAG: SpoIIIAH-like family protein [Desulfitobacteriaceae bacterium]